MSACPHSAGSETERRTARNAHSRLCMEKLQVVLSLLSRAICMALVLGSVPFEAMLETAPRRWNRVVEGRTHALMQSNQREILGIVFHVLRIWHSGFSGLVVGIAGEYYVAINLLSYGQRLRTALSRGELRCIDWVRRKELFSANLCILLNIPYHTNLNNFETACGLPHWPWCLFLGLFTLFPAHTAPGSSGCGHCDAPKKTSILRSAAFKPVLVAALRRGEWCSILVQICCSICTWLSLQTDYAIRPSWTPPCRGLNNWQ